VNWDQIQGHWTQIRGTAKERWGRLTDDDLDIIDGRRERLVGRLQVRYGMAAEQAERAVDDWLLPLSTLH
jgi:uncharacterized protein YjbJ (UPF0337 family)